MSLFAQQKITELKAIIAKKTKKQPSKKQRLYRPVEKSTIPVIKLKSTRQPKSPLLPISTLSKQSNGAGEIFSKLRQIGWLNKKLSAEIGRPLSTHIRIIRIYDEQVVLSTNNPAWAQRARFATDDILRILNKFYAGRLTTIKIQMAHF